MKLLRFVLHDDPSQVRSGIAAAGRVYETEDGEGVGIHEAAEVRPLAPVAKCGSVRIFHRDFQPEGVETGREDPVFFYANPNALIGPSQIVPQPDALPVISFQAYIAAVVLGDAANLEPEEADGIYLGATIMVALTSPTLWDLDRTLGRGFGRSHDAAMAIGPAITTPDELEDFVAGEEFGRRYQLATTARVNGVEVGRGDTSELSVTLAQAAAAASQTCPLREGDVIAVGPIVDFTSPITLDEGDEIQVAVESLGALSIRIGNPQTGIYA